MSWRMCFCSGVMAASLRSRRLRCDCGGEIVCLLRDCGMEVGQVLQLRRGSACGLRCGYCRLKLRCKPTDQHAGAVNGGPLCSHIIFQLSDFVVNLGHHLL